VKSPERAGEILFQFSFLLFSLLGMPASAVRAGFMVSLVFLAQVAGRRISSLRALIVVRILDCFIQPFSSKI